MCIGLLSVIEHKKTPVLYGGRFFLLGHLGGFFGLFDFELEQRDVADKVAQDSRDYAVDALIPCQSGIDQRKT